MVSLVLEKGLRPGLADKSSSDSVLCPRLRSERRQSDKDAQPAVQRTGILPARKMTPPHNSTGAAPLQADTNQPDVGRYTSFARASINPESLFEYVPVTVSDENRTGRASHIHHHVHHHLHHHSHTSKYDALCQHWQAPRTSLPTNNKYSMSVSARESPLLFLFLFVHFQIICCCFSFLALRLHTYINTSL